MVSAKNSLIALLLLLCLVAPCEARKKKSDKKWKCTIYAFDAKTGQPTAMYCPMNGVIVQWERVKTK